MTVFQHLRPGLQGDYKGDYSPPMKHACCSQGVYFQHSADERKTTASDQRASAVVTPVVRQNGGNVRLAALLTTDYSSISKEKNRREKAAPREYAREGSQAPIGRHASTQPERRK
jgi:hypothetical protein